MFKWAACSGGFGRYRGGYSGWQPLLWALNYFVTIRTNCVCWLNIIINVYLIIHHDDDNERSSEYKSYKLRHLINGFHIAISNY